MDDSQVSEVKKLVHVRSRADLLAEGYTDRALRRALGAGTMRKLGRWWFGSSATPPDVAAALGREHRLTCVSALALHGVFVIETPGVHEVGRQCRCSGGDDVIQHRPLRSWPDDEPIMPMPLALAHAARCLNAEATAMSWESALNKKLVSLDELTTILQGLPRRTQRAIGRLDHRAMSGPETRVRRFLERRGVQVVPQYPLEDGGFADLLVGEVLLIECDSIGHHTDAKAYAADRARDRRNVLRGYTVVRLTYHDVMDNWVTTRATLLALIRQGAHRKPRPQRRPRPKLSRPPLDPAA